MGNRLRNKEFYAIQKCGHRHTCPPTIFSSWGDAHPHTVGKRAEHRSFFTLEEARAWLEKATGADQWREIIKDGAGDTTPAKESTAFDAVANGRDVGIRECYYGKKGSEREVDKVSGNCHKHFKTREQAEAFIEDWKKTVVELYCESMMKALNEGQRPKTMNFDVSKLFSDEAHEDEEVSGAKAMFKGLSIGKKETV